jgi:hypothetical protein
MRCASAEGITTEAGVLGLYGAHGKSGVLPVTKSGTIRSGFEPSRRITVWRTFQLARLICQTHRASDPEKCRESSSLVDRRGKGFAVKSGGLDDFVLDYSVRSLSEFYEKTDIGRSFFGGIAWHRFLRNGATCRR